MVCNAINGAASCSRIGKVSDQCFYRSMSESERSDHANVLENHIIAGITTKIVDTCILN